MIFFRPQRDLFTVILSRQSFVTSILCVLTQIRKLQGGKFSLNVILKMLSSLFLLENLLNFISMTFRNVKYSWKKAILNSFMIIQSIKSINQSLFFLR